MLASSEGDGTHYSPYSSPVLVFSLLPDLLIYKYFLQVEARLDDLKDTATGNKVFLDGHVSKIDGITTDLKRKWQDSFTHAESCSKENADFTAAKHCRIELLMQKWFDFAAMTLLFSSSLFSYAS